MKVASYYVPSFEEDQVIYFNNILNRIINAVNNIEFGTLTGTTSHTENIWCTFVVTPGDNGANEACSATHELKKKPLGTIAIWQDKAATLYKPTAAISADTTTAVFYIFDTAATSAVLLLI